MDAMYQGFDLTGKHALVTGGARGIGKAIGVGLAQAGADIIIVDLLPTEAAETVAEIEALGRRARYYSLDLLDIAQIQPTFDRIAAEFGPIDILVNNAGTSVRKSALDITEADWDRVVGFNLKALFFCSQAAARQMIPRGGGKIINVSSTHATIAIGRNAPYGSSKGGVSSLTRDLALEWIPYGINVNAIAPGPIGTPRVLANDIAQGRTGEVLAAEMKRRVPLGRRLFAEELVGGVLLLASQAGAAMVGHVLTIDGAQTVI
jgi:2-dehydro-3-deoxy-D-gluconate 5-dehydrogenase